MVDLDFGDLLTEIGGRVKRQPYGRPKQQALPSEQAIGDLVKGAEEAISIPANYSDGTPTPNQPTGEMLSLPDSQASATMQGIADEPANSKDVYLTPLDDSQKSLISTGADEPVLTKRTIDDDIADAQGAVKRATDAPVEKQSFWKDFGAKLIQGADAFFNGNRAPIVGWGRLKHDQAIQNANAKLNPLIAQKKQEQEFAYNDTRRQNVIDDNIQKRNELFLKKQIADNKEANAKAILADKKLGRELQSTQIQDLKEYRNALIANGTRMTDARIKQIDERLADYDLDREQRDRVNDTNRDKGRPKNNVPLPPTPSQQLTPEQGSAVLKAISKMPPAQQAQAKANFYKQNPHLAK